MNKIEYGTEFLDQLKDKVHEQQWEIERLEKENERYRIAINEMAINISKSIDFIKENCILSDCWKDLDFCNFVPNGKIKYKALSSKKVKVLLDILKRAKLTENDKKQIKWLKEEFKVGVDKE